MGKLKINYSSAGVNYNVIDPVKKLAQETGQQTADNLTDFNFKEVTKSRGESAYVWEETDCYKAFVIEGLGTKNLVADKMSQSTGKTYYDAIAQDAIAAIVNDVITVGAAPLVINAYFGTGGSDWFSNEKRSADLVAGWAKACNLAGATWGGGETPSLAGIINPETLDLVGSCIGIIKPKERLTLGDKLKEGDTILLIESSGIHTNGLSLTRALAEKLPDGFTTKLPDGTLFGEVLLTPSHLYVSLINGLFAQNIDISYMVNITGHGWRKLMRANKDFTYSITQVPAVPQIFEFIKKESDNDDYEMYGNFNMGAGFAIFLPENQVEKARAVAGKLNLKSWKAGVVEKGPKQVIIGPKNITFTAETLMVR